MFACKKIFTIAVALFIFSCQLAFPVFAANEVNFLVTPILPGNQRPDTSGYFDLIVEPAQTQQLSIEAVNKANEDIVVEVEAITASTNLNGVINYTTQGEHHTTLPHNLADLIAIDEQTVLIPANSSKVITVTLSMPAERYEGYLLGSIHIKKQLTEEELGSGQMILNQYSYVVAIKLAQDEQNVENNFVLEEIQAELVNGRASVVNYIANPEAILVKGMDTKVRIYPQGSDTPLMERSMTATDMAPNSVFPFTIEDSDGYNMKAGNYRSLVDIEYNGQVWSLEKEFTIEPEQAAQIQNNAVDLGNQQNAMTSSLPPWVTAAIVVGIVLFIAIVILLVVLIKKTRQN